MSVLVWLPLTTVVGYSCGILIDSTVDNADLDLLEESYSELIVDVMWLVDKSLLFCEITHEYVTEINEDLDDTAADIDDIIKDLDETANESDDRVDSLEEVVDSTEETDDDLHERVEILEKLVKNSDGIEEDLGKVRHKDKDTSGFPIHGAVSQGMHLPWLFSGGEGSPYLNLLLVVIYNLFMS